MRNDRWKSKLLITGTLAGAALGMTTAYLMARQAEKEGNELNLTTRDMMRALPGVIAAVRSISSLGAG